MWVWYTKTDTIRKEKFFTRKRKDNAQDIQNLSSA